ncbi:hypothetical protein JB92DRAFT_2828787 [Gautieria morchelliformis]|nr:hypothetical protein JB92DRAFT_2828787 [Gautieria morchelliformis]
MADEDQKKEAEGKRGRRRDRGKIVGSPRKGEVRTSMPPGGKLSLWGAPRQGAASGREGKGHENRWAGDGQGMKKETRDGTVAPVRHGETVPSLKRVTTRKNAVGRPVQLYQCKFIRITVNTVIRARANPPSLRRESGIDVIPTWTHTHATSLV